MRQVYLEILLNIRVYVNKPCYLLNRYVNVFLNFIKCVFHNADSISIILYICAMFN